MTHWLFMVNQGRLVENIVALMLRASGIFHKKNENLNF